MFIYIAYYPAYDIVPKTNLFHQLDIQYRYRSILNQGPNPTHLKLSCHLFKTNLLKYIKIKKKSTQTKNGQTQFLLI